MTSLIVAGIVAHAAPLKGAALFYAAAATAVASYIDNAFILPHLFPNDLEDSPGLPTPQRSFADEGAGSSYPIGRTVRIPGQYIWASEYKTAIYRDSSGVKLPTFKMDCEIAAAVLPAGFNSSNGISVLKVYGNGLPIWVSDAFKTITIGPNNKLFLTRPSNVTDGDFPWDVWIHSPSDGPDLRELEPTGSISSMTGWSKEYNLVPGTVSKNATVLGVTLEQNDRTQARLRMTLNVKAPASYKNFNVNEVAGNNITIIQDAPNIRRSRASAVTTIKGKGDLVNDEVKNTTLASAVDPTNKGVPHHAYTAAARINDMVLYEFGNRPPQPELLVDATGLTTVNEAIGYILDRSTLASGINYHRNDTDLDNEYVEGYNILGLEAPAKSLEPLMLAYDIVSQVQTDAIFFFKRENATEWEVDKNTLGAVAKGQSPDSVPYPFEVEEVPPDQLPTAVTVTYIEDPDPSITNIEPTYSEAAVTARLIGNNTSTTTPPVVGGVPKLENHLQVNIPITMQSKEAQKIADRLLRRPWINRYKCRGTLLPSNMPVLENDILKIDNEFGKNWRILLTKVDRGANGIIEWEGVSETAAGLVDIETSNSVKLPHAKRTKLPPKLPPVRWQAFESAFT